VLKLPFPVDKSSGLGGTPAGAEALSSLVDLFGTTEVVPCYKAWSWQGWGVLSRVSELGPRGTYCLA